LGSMLRVCLWYCEQQACNIQCSENNQGHTSSLPPPVVALAGGEGGAGRPNLRSSHREEWVWRISSRGSSAPPSDGASSAGPGAIVGHIVGRKASDPVMMSITARPGSSSGFHGGATTIAPYNTGPMLPTSSAGQVGSATPRIHPLQCCCENVLRCWWARIPMYCVMLDFWRLLLVVLDPFAANFDVA
jgi:hypothetical protein